MFPKLAAFFYLLCLLNQLAESAPSKRNLGTDEISDELAEYLTTKRFATDKLHVPYFFFKRDANNMLNVVKDDLKKLIHLLNIGNEVEVKEDEYESYNRRRQLEGNKDGLWGKRDSSKNLNIRKTEVELLKRAMLNIQQREDDESYNGSKLQFDPVKEGLWGKRSKTTKQ